MAIKVTLRQKLISKGRKSLYLDIYPPIPHSITGKPTRREFLNMYLFIDKAELKKELSDKKGKGNNYEALLKLYNELKPLSSVFKQHNTETQIIAETIRQKRENILNKPEVYSQFEKEQLRIKELSKQNFVEYFKKLANKRKASNHDNWISALHYLEKFTAGKITFGKLNQAFFDNFKDYLLTTKSKKSDKTILSTNTAVSYFNKVKAALKQAYKEGLLQTDLNSKVEGIKIAETEREYLTIEELNRLVKTPCNNVLLKRAALFSALTGMRFSDIQKLTWHELEYIEGQGYFIKFIQQKTKGVEVLPISEQAYNLLGEKKDPTSKVFSDLKYSAFNNKHLYQWIGAAGISKDITFHCFRHTYATLQLANGTDITTVSKMLGHRELKTTQIYAKIVDKAKRDATDKIKLDL
jgi:integrase